MQCRRQLSHHTQVVSYFTHYLLRNAATERIVYEPYEQRSKPKRTKVAVQFIRNFSSASLTNYFTSWSTYIYSASFTFYSPTLSYTFLFIICFLYNFPILSQRWSLFIQQYMVVYTHTQHSLNIRAVILWLWFLIHRRYRMSTNTFNKSGSEGLLAGEMGVFAGTQKLLLATFMSQKQLVESSQEPLTIIII